MATSGQIHELDRQARELRDRCLEETRRTVTSGGVYPEPELELTWLGPLNGWARVQITLPGKAPYIHQIRI